MSEAVISLSNAFIYQKENLILSDVNFSINKGEFVYLIGKTGSGKSSLLKTLYADLWLEKGSGKVAGFALENIRYKEIPFLRRKIGIIFQDFQLLPDRNVLQNLRFFMEAMGWDDKMKIDDRIVEVLELVGLPDVLKKHPHQLSGGEQQRIAIARALINNPKLILADEPTGNLDTKTANQLHELFFKLRQEFGQTFIIVTHNPELADMADRKLTMKDGLIV